MDEDEKYGGIWQLALGWQQGCEREGERGGETYAAKAIHPHIYTHGMNYTHKTNIFSLRYMENNDVTQIKQFFFELSWIFQLFSYIKTL